MTLNELIKSEQGRFDELYSPLMAANVRGAMRGLIEEAMTTTAKAVGELVRGAEIDMSKAGNIAAAITRGEDEVNAWNYAIATVQSALKTFLGEEI